MTLDKLISGIEIPSDEITFLNVIGEGNFGKVYKGTFSCTVQISFLQLKIRLGRCFVCKKCSRSEFFEPISEKNRNFFKFRLMEFSWVSEIGQGILGHFQSFVKFLLRHVGICFFVKRKQGMGQQMGENRSLCLLSRFLRLYFRVNFST